MLEEIVAHLDHVPRATFTQVCLTIVVIVFIMVVITTHRRDRRQDQDQQLSTYTLGNATTRILGKTDIQASEWCRVKWSITKNGQLLFRGRARMPAREDAKTFLDDAVTERLQTLPQCETLEGIELDPTWVTALWNEGVITRDHFLKSFNTPTGVEFQGIAFGGQNLRVHFTDNSRATMPIRFLTRQRLLIDPDPSDKEAKHFLCKAQLA